LKVQRMELRRFKSVREVILPGSDGGQILDNLIVLIGRNSSGKTNLLEAVDFFFREFDAAFERSIGPVNPELWYNRETGDPIEWNVTLQLEQNELNSLFGKDFVPLFERIDKRDQVTTLRRIVATPQDMRWQTATLRVGNVDLVRDAKAMATEEIAKGLSSEQPPPANLVQNILSNFSALLRSEFKYIGAARDSVQSPPSFGNRASIINPATLSSINNLAQGMAADIRKKWTPLRSKMEDTLPNRERVDSKGGQLFLENEPLPATGGGTQTVLALIHDIETGPPIIAIEEPENHLHPELIKKILRYFQNVTSSTSPKQLFIATHSPFLVDSTQVKGVVALYWDGQKTQARQIGTKDQLRSALFDIGARPSDILFADLVLIVEGESDKIVLQNWARTLGVPLEQIHAAVVPARGVNKTRYHLKLWAEISKEIGLPRYVSGDKSGQEEVNQVLTAGLVETDNAHVLERGDLEDYYQVEVLAEVLKATFGVDTTPEELPTPGRVKAITKLIKRDPHEWKVILSEEMSRKTERRHIPREIGDFLRRIYSENSR
jgi:hypothetical protein